MEKTLDLVALGEAMIEFNQTGDLDYRRGFGGDTSNAVIAASRMGARCGYISQLGDDRFGEALLALWQQENIDISGVRTLKDSATGVYFVEHDTKGHHFSYCRKGSAASQIRPQDLPLDVIASARQLHVSGISMGISQSACDSVFAAIRHARQYGTRVSLDMNYRPRLWSVEQALPRLQQALADTDLFFPSVDECQLLTGLSDIDDILRWSHEHGARQVVLKLGADGCIVSDGQSRQHLSGQRVNPVDATGAGDCFAGTCLARLAAGDSLINAARAANIAAALSTTGVGAVAPLPRWPQVAALLDAAT